MPRKTTAAAQIRQPLFKRRVRAASVSYPVRAPGPDGRVVEVFREASKGDEITADAFTIMRLDSLGMLAPPGATAEDVEREADERLERYRAARRSVGGAV